jgi:GNAT superfamily N-acetyltransferase
MKEGTNSMMGSSSSIIRLYSKGDEKAYVSLMNYVFSRYRCDLQRWRWEFANSPLGSIQVFADFDGKIIGHMGLICLPIKIGNHVVWGSQAVDLAVHPSFRGKGIFIKMGKKLMQEAAKKHIIISYGVPNEPAYRGHLKYGWFYVSEIPVLVKLMTKKGLIIFALARILNFIKKPCLESMSKLFCTVKGLKTQFGLRHIENFSQSHEYNISTLASFDEKVDRLWEKASKQYPLIIVRNSKYLNWRYFDKPHSKYIVLAAIRKHEVDGFVVLAIDVHPMLKLKRGYIVDLFAKSENAIHHLLQSTFKYFTKEHVDSIICWSMKRHPLYDCLLEKGFIQDHFNSQKLICRINTENSNFRKYYYKFEKDWYFMMGDSDII